jgi:hypothetical protein
MNEDGKAISTTEPGSEVGFDKLIERWWSDHFPGSAVARDTAAWNAAHRAKEALKRLLLSARRSPGEADKDSQRSI